MVDVALHPTASLPFSDSLGTEALELVDRRPKAYSVCGDERGAVIEVTAFMCGIAGIWDLPRDASGVELKQVVLRMASALRHRGPDDQGIWADPRAGLALGHRRLAILDLSAEGRQPMHSADGNYVLAFNGEIYNFGALRRRLEKRGHTFRGHSDTEVML